MNFTYHKEALSRPVLQELVKPMRIALTTNQDTRNDTTYYPKLRKQFEKQSNALLAALVLHPNVLFAKVPAGEGEGYHSPTKTALSQSVNITSGDGYDGYIDHALTSTRLTNALVERVLRERSAEFIIVHFIIVHTVGLGVTDFYIELGCESLKAGEHEVHALIRRHLIDEILDTI